MNAMGIQIGQHQSLVLGFYSPLFETYVQLVVLDSLTFEKISLSNGKNTTLIFPKEKVGSDFLAQLP